MHHDGDSANLPSLEDEIAGSDTQENDSTTTNGEQEKNANELIAIPAEIFGDSNEPFYLCHLVENEYIPIDRKPFYVNVEDELKPKN